MILFLVGSSMIIFNIKTISNKVLISFLLLAFSYLLIISLSQFKRFWYDMPLFPFLAVIAAYPIVYLINNYFNKSIKNKYRTPIIIILIFIYPVICAFEKSQANAINSDEKKIEASEMYIFNKINKNENYIWKIITLFRNIKPWNTRYIIIKLS